MPTERELKTLAEAIRQQRSDPEKGFVADPDYALCVALVKLGKKDCDAAAMAIKLAIEARQKAVAAIGKFRYAVKHARQTLRNAADAVEWVKMQDEGLLASSLVAERCGVSHDDLADEILREIAGETVRYILHDPDAICPMCLNPTVRDNDDNQART